MRIQRVLERSAHCNLVFKNYGTIIYTHTANTRQQLSACSREDMVETTYWSSKWPTERGRKGDWSDFERGTVVCARRGGLRTWQPSPGFTGERSGKAESSQQQLCGGKCRVDVRVQRRMDRLGGDRRKALESQITTGDNRGMQNTIFGCTTRPTVKLCVYIQTQHSQVAPNKQFTYVLFFFFFFSLIVKSCSRR